MTHVATQTHELEANLKYPYWGLGPYHALSKAIIGVFDPADQWDTTIQGEDWSIKAYVSKSGFAPRPEDLCEYPSFGISSSRKDLTSGWPTTSGASPVRSTEISASRPFFVNGSSLLGLV